MSCQIHHRHRWAPAFPAAPTPILPALLVHSATIALAPLGTVDVNDMESLAEEIVSSWIVEVLAVTTATTQARAVPQKMNMRVAALAAMA